MALDPIWYRECDNDNCDYWDEREWKGEPDKVCPKCGSQMRVYLEDDGTKW